MELLVVSYALHPWNIIRAKCPYITKKQENTALHWQRQYYVATTKSITVLQIPNLKDEKYILGKFTWEPLKVFSEVHKFSKTWNICNIGSRCSGKINCLNFVTTFHQHKTFKTYPGQSKKYFICSFDKRFIY